MKYVIKNYEELIAKINKGEKVSLQEENINNTMWWAYRKLEESENELIDFNDVIWDTDILEIANTLKANGIKEFTISSNFSGLISTLAEFDKLGITMAGMTEVNARYKNWRTGEKERIPAIMMIVK